MDQENDLVQSSINNKTFYYSHKNFVGESRIINNIISY